MTRARIASDGGAFARDSARGFFADGRAYEKIVNFDRKAISTESYESPEQSCQIVFFYKKKESPDLALLFLGPTKEWKDVSTTPTASTVCAAASFRLRGRFSPFVPGDHTIVVERAEWTANLDHLSVCHCFCCPRISCLHP